MAEGIIAQHTDITETYNNTTNTYPTYVTTLNVNGLIAYVIPAHDSNDTYRITFQQACTYCILKSANMEMINDKYVNATSSYILSRGQNVGINREFRFSSDGITLTTWSDWTLDMIVFPVYTSWITTAM